MFDPETARLLRSAPALSGLDSENLPQLLTQRYAELVSARLRGAEGRLARREDDEWPLERIADTYELVTSVIDDEQSKRASAFVAGTAHQILSRQSRAQAEDDVPPLHRDGVDSSVAAGLLFLAAEQYADANEASFSMRTQRNGAIYEIGILAEHLRDLASGKLQSLLERAERWRKSSHQKITLQSRAMHLLVESLITGVEILAADILSVPGPPAGYGRFDSARHAFQRVLELSSHSSTQLDEDMPGLVTMYAGPRHLASLLLAACDGIEPAALTKVQPPSGANAEFWTKWLHHRAKICPYLWRNHREAIEKNFYETGKSAVMVLPTGAGKTTVSSLKIAGVLARKKKVVFLAPTHALVEQLTEDLQEMFPEELLGSVVSSDFDMLMLSNATIKEIEVMTPERCLAMLSFAPSAFADVGLLVFDECHLLSPQSGKIRRALDGMLCLLSFNRITPDADTLFMSAMLKNGQEFSDWIASLTGRDSVFVDLLWKPSRQARGVVIFKDKDLENIRAEALVAHRAQDAKEGRRAEKLRKVGQNKLSIRPWAIWGLQHNWLSKSEKKAICSFTPVSDETVPLTGQLHRNAVRLTPNANQVAAKLAVSAAQNDVKTIVFVNTKTDAVSTADDISEQMDWEVEANKTEGDRWRALELELGGLQHSLLKKGAAAVPHNSSMLRLERDLAERVFRRADGAKVIVATPTLAQGLNLPAQLAILAGDKRASADGREDLEAHELLNAAARAGRAGHLANGVVLLVPEPIISFTKGQRLEGDVVRKLRSILPEDDRCVSIDDPLAVVLDRIIEGKLSDRDVRYTINRMATIQEADNEAGTTTAFNLSRSLGAYAAQKRAKQKEFDRKLAALQAAVAQELNAEIHPSILALSSQSGLPTSVLQRLRAKIESETGSLPINVVGWTNWTLQWLAADAEARDLLLHEVARSIAGATGQKKDTGLSADALQEVTKGVIAWLRGKPLRKIEEHLGGDPDSGRDTKRVCPRARELVGTVIPRGLSFIIGIVSRVVEDVGPFDHQETLDSELMESLTAAVRKGFDSPAKLNYANERKNLLGRVQAHLEWEKDHLSEA